MKEMLPRKRLVLVTCICTLDQKMVKYKCTGFLFILCSAFSKLFEICPGSDWPEIQRLPKEATIGSLQDCLMRTLLDFPSLYCFVYN
jgi:hypothetical protein